jgi:nucleoside-diphosphate-sugar epimerase
VRVNARHERAVAAVESSPPACRHRLSGEVYGTAEHLIVNEDAPVRLANLIRGDEGRGRGARSQLGDRGERAVVIPGTNQIGPSASGTAASAFAEGRRGRGRHARAAVRHGTPTRGDFLDVRDMADATRAAELADPGTHIFNVGTGRGTHLRDFRDAHPARASGASSTLGVRSGAATTFALDASPRAHGWEPRTPGDAARDLLDLANT